MLKEIYYSDDFIQEYYSRMGYTGQPSDKKHFNKLLKKAMEIRNFEIELYWKRANYFWLFNAALLAALILLQKQVNFENDACNLTVYFNILIGFLGIIFSFAWFLVNKGSKFWQQNWELHVEQIEKQLKNEAMYDIILCNSKLNIYSPKKEYPFSVSKINQLVSFCVFLFWIFVDLIYICSICSETNLIIYTIIFLFITIIVVLYFIKNTKTSIFSKNIDLSKGEKMRIFSRKE